LISNLASSRPGRLGRQFSLQAGEFVKEAN
jgi:hypothetical protein